MPYEGQYPVSALLSRTTFAAFCQLHRLKSRDWNMNRLRSIKHYLRHNWAHNDIAGTNLKAPWTPLDAAITRCHSDPTKAKLWDLVDFMFEIGGDKAGFICQVDVDRHGNVKAERLDA